jgi:FkbH-like protein
MTLETSLPDDRQKLVQALTERIDELIQVWQILGASGPGRDLAGPAEIARVRYLLPLAKAFTGALSGSPNHSALYFDERMRFIDKTEHSDQIDTLLQEDFSLEFKAIADLLDDELPPAMVERELREFHSPLLSPPEPASKVLFIGDCLLVETRAFLTRQMIKLGHPTDVRNIFFSTSQPMDSANSAIVNEVKRYRPDLIGMSLFTYEGVPPYTYAFRRAGMLLGSRRQSGTVEGLVELVRSTIEDIRTASDAAIAVHIPCGALLDKIRRRIPILPPHSGGQRHLLAELTEGLRELIASSENVLTVEEPAIADKLGGIRIAAAPAFAEDDVPSGYAHVTRLGPALASYYSGLLTDHSFLGRAKVLLVDFDNTLWQGVMAETDVVHETARQELVLELKNSGILLVALSKNSESAIRWDEMRLAKSDFALKKINWQPKPDNVAAAIKELDLAADTFILLDDNPVERALVTEMIPGVRALDPSVPETWRSLRRWLSFPSTRQTEEARRRTDMYREAAERRVTLSGPHDYEAMMKSLELRYQFTLATAADMPRLVELIGRTNQFNTTTRRRSLGEIGELISSAEKRVFVASLRDKFGDLGVVAVVIFNLSERLFDSVIMSCRAMGFGLEFAMLENVISSIGPGDFHGLFIPTNRNGPASELFGQAGFRRESDLAWLLPAGAKSPKAPSWLIRSP